MQHLSRLHIEIMVAGVVLVLFFLNFLHPLIGTPEHLSSKSADLWVPASTVDADKLIVVYVTTPSKEIGKGLANSIISNRLAACVNQIPGIESTYWWNGKVVSDTEVLLMIKTRESLFNALSRHVKANHPYEVPEVIAVAITEGSKEYIQWLKESTAVV